MASRSAEAYVVEDDPELLPGGVKGVSLGPEDADGLLPEEEARPLTENQQALGGGMHHPRAASMRAPLGVLQRGATKAGLLEQSHLARARTMFNKYNGGVEEPMTYGQFATMMRAEFDADHSTIDQLWSLEGFTSRTADVSRRVVVTSDSFVLAAVRLGLFGRRTAGGPQHAAGQAAVLRDEALLPV